MISYYIFENIVLHVKTKLKENRHYYMYKKQYSLRCFKNLHHDTFVHNTKLLSEDYCDYQSMLDDCLGFLDPVAFEVQPFL